jgi:hypothetical protein
MPIHNLQKSGEVMHAKVDRQASFVLHGTQGKRGGTMVGPFSNNKFTTAHHVQIN